MASLLARITRQRRKDHRKAERFIRRRGVGSLPGRRFENGESAGQERSDWLHAAKDATVVSYDNGTTDEWEGYMRDHGLDYLPLVGSGASHQTLEQLEKQERMRHVLTFLLPVHIDLLFMRHVEGKSLEDIAAEFGTSRQNISKRLSVAEQDFKREFGKHWNDELEVDLSVDSFVYGREGEALTRERGH